MMCHTDFHSHILPGVDDGSRSVKESLKMLSVEADQGVRRVVATPHFYANHDTPERFLERREAAWGRLREATAGHPELPQIIPGAEVYYFAGMSESDALPALTIGGSGFLLLEMPQGPWTQSMYREMEAIYVKQGITPIIAHVDRYIGPFRTWGIPKQLAELPVLVQANAEFFLSRYTAGMALRMLRQENIHLLGSDCHDLTSRKPNLGTALEQIENRLGKHALSRIQEYEDRVLGSTRD
jgi:protein-tyrosine phosphatase